MKNHIIYLSISIILLSGSILFAHGDKAHKKEQMETIQSEHSVADHKHATEHMNHHDLLVLKESSTVEASLRDFPNLHPLVVHFPIVLVLLAEITQIVTFFLWKRQLIGLIQSI